MTIPTLTGSGLGKGDLITALMEAAVDAVIVIDHRGVIKECSGSTSELFGYSRSELIGSNVSMLMPEPEASAHDGYIDNYVSSGNAKIIGIGRDVKGRKRSGEIFHLHLSVGESEIENERLFVGICHDLTDYHQALQKVADAEQRYRDILHSQRQFICRLDSNLRITFANASFVRALGVEDKALLGCPISLFTDEHGETARQLLSDLFEGTAEDEEISVKISMQSQSGSRALVDWTFRRAGESSRGEQELQGFGIDISGQERALQQARYFRRHDPLTGFLNKRSFLEAAAKSVRDDTRWAFLHFDCERFRLVNQRHGYETGDGVLIEIAARIKRYIERTNLCARIGADNFLVAVALDENEDPLAYARDFLTTVTRAFLVNGQTLQLEGKVGVAIFPDHSDVLENLPELAESASLRAGNRGDNRVALFDPEYQRAMQRRLDVEQRLKVALQSDRLDIFLQPKYRVTDIGLVSYEALIRWTDPELGVVSPAEFVPLAEQSSLGFDLDRYVIGRVLDLVEKEISRFEAFPPIAINITANHFTDSGFSVFLLDQLSRRNLQPSVIQLEITEGVIMEHSGMSSDNLALLRREGVRISIDDFGTGYSSLSYLRRLEVDELKIDRSFINEIQTKQGAALVRSVIQITKAFGINVVAEGVETRAQLEALRSMGCDYCQGFLLSKPLPAIEALDLFFQK